VQYQRPVLVQQQKLKMNPQLYQSIQMMAMPLHELKFKIQEELERNPALELVEDRSEVSLDEQEAAGQTDEYDYFDDSSDPGYTREEAQAASDAKKQFLEGALSRPETLHDHLMWQLRLQPLSKDEFTIGELLILNLDDDGFHQEQPENLVKPPWRERLSAVIDLIREFDPIGTCTSGYRESLWYQAQREASAPEGTIEVLEKYLDLLEREKYQEIARKMKTSPEQIEEIRDFIRTLNPFPGRQYSTDETQYVIPDLMVRMKDGEFVLILNDEEIPVLGVNPFFDKLLKDQDEKPEKAIKQFVTANVKDAKWFIRSVKQRSNTLLKIARAIVEFQRDFFLRGAKYLVPLTLKDIASEVGVHETTVSRIANSKYVQTEWGIFELRYFFTNSISGTGSSGSRFSKEGVKEIIREIISEQDSAKHMSDQKIADVLASRGIQIARRTVAKYRNELDIGSSYGR
jgi:RNA polymerase sigma-54 factor